MGEVELLVESLSRRLQRGEPNAIFSIAVDVCNNMRHDEQIKQLQRMLQRLGDVLGGREGIRASLLEALIHSVGALVLLAAYNNNNNNTSSSSSATSPWLTDEMEANFSRCVEDVLRAHPSYSDEVVAGVCYTVAQIITQGRCSSILSRCCASLTTAREEDIPCKHAVEVLASCASILVLRGKPELPNLILPTATPTTTTSSSARTTNKEKGSGKRGKKPTTSAEDVTHTTSAHADATPTDVMDRLIIQPDVAHHVRTQLTSCALSSLGPSGAAQHDASVIALICRRVLIPSLLVHGGGRLLRGDDVQLHNVVASMSVQRTDEAVVLIAALFDCLFGTTQENNNNNNTTSDVRDDDDEDDGAMDYRASPLLWDVVQRTLREAIIGEGDAGKRAVLQLRADYLLKRIVHLTECEEKRLAITNTRVLHEVFPWCGGGVSSTSWATFFLLLETFNEFGLHIIAPALTKLDALTEQLCTSLQNNDDDDHHLNHQHTTFALHPSWIELLYLKLVLHPNIGIRRVGLRRLWLLPTPVLRSFTMSAIFFHAFRSGADPRLCSDLDRTTISATFLDTKAFEGEEVRALPDDVEPLAAEMERFYGEVLFPVVLRTTQERTSAMLMMLRAMQDKPPRFTVSIFVRILHRIAESMLREVAMMMMDEGVASSCADVFLHEEVLELLASILRDSVQENIPFWLEVRVSSIAFSALISVAAMQPRKMRHHSAFWRVLALCGPLGQSGGRSVAKMEACGQYGSVGSGAHPALLHHRLWSVAESVVETTTTTTTSSSGMKRWRTAAEMIREMLDVDTLVERTHALLSSNIFDEVGVKTHFFLLGALAKDVECGTLMLRTLATCVCDAITSLRSRAYRTAGSMTTSMAALVELHKNLGNTQVEHFMSTSVVEEMLATLMDVAMHALEDGWAMTMRGHLHALSDDGTSSSSCARDAIVAVAQTAHWDVLCAAIVSCLQMMLRTTNGAVRAAEVIHAEKQVHALIHFLRRHATQASSNTNTTTTSSSSLNESSAEVQAILARNAARLAQSVLSGFATMDHREAPFELDGVEVGCFLPIDANVAAQFLRDLCDGALPPSRTSANKTSSSPLLAALTDEAWPTLMAQHARGVYDCIFVLLYRLMDQDLQQQQQQHGKLIAHVASFAQEQAEQCWSSNLASLFNIMAWCAARGGDDDVATELDCVALSSCMLERMRDVGARQHALLASIAFLSLQHALPHNVEYVREVLLSTLTNELECTDRNTYFVAVAATNMLLAKPDAHWPHVMEVLLHTAILVNPGRDEEEQESTLAATEALMCVHWPDEVRAFFPPTVRMAGVGRALSIAAVLWCCRQSPQRAKELSLHLLSMNTTHDVVKHEPCMPNSRPHRTRIRLWQLICALLPLIPTELDEVRPLFQHLIHDCFPINNLGSVRRLMELYGIRLLQHQPSLYTMVADVLANYTLRPQVCGSYVLIACHALLQNEARATPSSDIFHALFPRLMQQGTSNQHLLRIISHIGIFRVCNARLKRGEVLETEALAMFHYIAKAPEHTKFREKHEEMLFFDAEAAASPRSLFCVQRKEANTILRESIPASTFERIRFLATEVSALTGSLQRPVEELRARGLLATTEMRARLNVFRHESSIPHTAHMADYCVEHTPEAMELLRHDPNSVAPPTSATPADGQPPHAQDNIQRKVSSWWCSEVYQELHPRALGTNERQSLIVVGSLLENPVNIAGLCRCGDIFNVEEVVVPDAHVFAHPHFVATARSAELWIPWSAVPPKDLPSYFEALRMRGYTLVGVEQTASSTSMEVFTFPKKCAMVLGAEGQGIPAALIPLLDVCVEIPQYGLIRSLNVHVTGGICIYEYVRQHLMTKQVPTTTATIAS